MNICRKSFGLFFTASLILTFFGLAEAQKRRQAARGQVPPKVRSVKSPPRTVSYGVVNGRSLNLVVPDFPEAALALRVKGQVTVLVTIDENGKVIDADALTGHPLLLASAIVAARSSTFAPLSLGGVPVRFRGVIVYNFNRNELNWLELGYAIETRNYVEPQTISTFLPGSYVEEKQLWEQFLIDRTEMRWASFESFTASVESRLSNDSKSLWLFRVGRALGNLPNGGDGCEDAECSRLTELIDSRPDGISPTLLASIRKLVSQRDVPEIFTITLRALIARLYGLGT